MSRHGRGFRPHKWTGAGIGYWPDYRESEMLQDEKTSRTNQKDRERNARLLRRGINFKRLYEGKKQLKSDISITQTGPTKSRIAIMIESDRVTGNKDRDVVLGLLISGLTKLSAQIEFIGHVLPRASGGYREDPLSDVKVPFTLNHDVDREELLNALLTRRLTISTVRRKGYDHRRILIQAKLPTGWNADRFFEEISNPAGFLRNV